MKYSIGGDIGSATSRRVENIYEVTTGMGDILWGVNTSITVRLSEDLFNQM